MIRALKFLSLFFFSFSLSALAAERVEQVLPSSDPGHFFYVFGPKGPTSYGKVDSEQKLMIDVPQTTQGRLTIAVYDPDTGGSDDRLIAPAYGDVQTTFIISGSKELDRLEVGREPYDKQWFNFGPYAPEEGEKIDGGYRFFLHVRATQGDDQNLYKVKISMAAEVYTDEASLAFKATAAPNISFYPRIPEGIDQVVLESNTTSNAEISDASSVDGQSMRQDALNRGLAWHTTRLSLEQDRKEKIRFSIQKNSQSLGNTTFRFLSPSGERLPIYFGKTDTTMKPSVKPVVSQPAVDPTTEAPSSGVGCNTFEFSALESYDPDNQKITYEWDFGDGQKSDQPKVLHTYQSGGKYQVTLTVKDYSGLKCDTAVTSQEVFVNDAPSADFKVPEQTCVGAPVTLEAVGEDSHTYEWFFADGSQLRGKQVTKEFSRGGEQVVRLKVDDNQGTKCSVGNATKTVFVNTPPAPNARLSYPGDPYRVSFDAQSSKDADQDSLSYKWSFGDGKTGEGPMVKHDYEGAGKYSVSLSVDDGRKTECSVMNLKLAADVKETPKREIVDKSYKKKLKLVDKSQRKKETEQERLKRAYKYVKK